ncbi:MAG TPA: PRC-barrel domain-containing protein [Methylomusa anaerophila]|uniref:PRC-barrel domain protein n=1 Tax=Methylomusa anaerophila TaxID=1930071 RepID=A0A348APT8_9FIRM|nr:PRC-barrel domain-containing protein [Methylomusa anaerophila]BBB93086.1 PRC-barrel domain protein [Methylomusa anaerophila]HML87081.1 PRC-barrel domain-containing protein [Methylomusa anaerophila]
MKKSAEIVGLSVVSITEGKECGRVKDILIDHTHGTVAALVIDDGKWYFGAKLLPFEVINGIGEYAVTIDNSSDLLPVTEQEELEKLLLADIKVIDTKVLTKGGQILGKITEVFVDPTGKISICEMVKDDGEIVHIPAERVLTFGKDVLIIVEENDIAGVTDQSIIESKPTHISEPITEIRVQQSVMETTAAVPTVTPSAGEEQSEEHSADDSAKRFDDKHRKFLLGKKASRPVEADNGTLIIDRGEDVTEEVLQKAKVAGKLVELSMSIQYEHDFLY